MFLQLELQQDSSADKFYTIMVDSLRFIPCLRFDNKQGNDNYRIITLGHVIFPPWRLCFRLFVGWSVCQQDYKTLRINLYNFLLGKVQDKTTD